MLQEWARHTGKFRENIDKPDYATWKTRLRCAFNKAPDIEEVKEESNLNCTDPFRVYRFKEKPGRHCISGQTIIMSTQLFC